MSRVYKSACKRAHLLPVTAMTQLQEPIRLEFSNNSVRRTTAQVDSLGIFYSVSKDDGIISVRRWEQRTNSEILIGQIDFRFLRYSRIRLGGEEKQWSYTHDFLRREHGFFLVPFVLFPITILCPDGLSSARTFTGNNGLDYRWCLPWSTLSVGRLPAPEDGSLPWCPALPG